MKHDPCCIWFTGLSGAGKTTLATILEEKLRQEGHRSCLLDGDDIRRGISKDLGFSAQDRIENIRRVAETAHLMVDAGLIVLVALISPFENYRENARKLFAAGEFIEVFVDAPLSVCERRDAKGYYAKARSGELCDFTGIDSPYEPPLRPDVHVRTHLLSVDQCLDKILERISRRSEGRGDS